MLPVDSWRQTVSHNMPLNASPPSLRGHTTHSTCFYSRKPKVPSSTLSGDQLIPGLFVHMQAPIVASSAAPLQHIIAQDTQTGMHAPQRQCSTHSYSRMVLSDPQQQEQHQLPPDAKLSCKHSGEKHGLWEIGLHDSDMAVQGPRRKKLPNGAWAKLPARYNQEAHKQGWPGEPLRS